MIGSLPEHIAELGADDASLVEQLDQDLTTARLIAQTHFGKGADRDRKLVIEIFKEISERRREEEG